MTDRQPPPRPEPRPPGPPPTEHPKPIPGPVPGMADLAILAAAVYLLEPGNLARATRAIQAAGERCRSFLTALVTDEQVDKPA